MSEIPPEQELLLGKIAEPGSGGTHAREAERARLDALLVQDLTASLGQLGGELLQTRNQMAASSAVASRHQRALVAWTAVLSFATVAYALAAFLPFFWRSVATSMSDERAWVLWDVSGGKWAIHSAYETKRECEAAQTKRAVLFKGSTPTIDRCLPDTVEPRGPKGK